MRFFLQNGPHKRRGLIRSKENLEVIRAGAPFLEMKFSLKCIHEPGGIVWICLDLTIAKHTDTQLQKSLCRGHGFDWLKLMVYVVPPEAMEATVMGIVKGMTDKMVPFQGDMDMLDFSQDNIYSEHMAKLVSWQRYYTRFWKQSMLFCNNRWPDFLNVYSSDGAGATGMVEPEYTKAVTGRDLSFEDGIELGRKIWNLDHAIWTLQGRHRDMVHFVDNVYEQQPLFPVDSRIPDIHMPGKEDGKWGFYGYSQRTLDRDKFDEFKTRFYELQGWDTATGYPTRATLESLALGYVADELEKNGKLGG